MFMMGGPVKGGKVYGKWPGLAPEQLNEGRDLKLTKISAPCSAKSSAAIWAARISRLFSGLRQ